jgi:hypothetical protein
MAGKIEKLTPQQEARLVEFRAEWLAHGLSTEPANREAAENAIAEMYTIIGKERPRFVWMSSPMGAVLLISAMKLIAEKRAEKEKNSGQLWDQLGGQLRGQLGGQLGGQLWDQLGDQLGDHARSEAYRSFWGQYEAYWIAYYAFAQEIGVKYPEEVSRRLGLWATVAQSAGWWWPYENMVVLSDRPSAVHMAGEGRAARLNNTQGPALAFRDGYGVYSVNGTRLPAEIIEHPEAITVKAVIDERNAEVRRVMVDQMGERFFREADAQVLDSDTDGGGQKRRLLRIDLNDDEPVITCEVQCPSTGHMHYLRVPPNITNCADAIAWTFDLPTDEYRTLVEA